MARPFTNSSSANKAFGTFSESQNSGDYTYNKKAKLSYCSSITCTPYQNIASSNNLLLYKRAKKLLVYPCLNSINKANLNVNLISKLDLSGVHVIEDFSGNTAPSTITTTSIPFLDYHIDPSGNLFGNTICGINNFQHYMVYDASYNTLHPGNISNL